MSGDFSYVPGVDWLLLCVKTVTDWLFTAGVEQQAGELMRDGERDSQSDLFRF